MGEPDGPDRVFGTFRDRSPHVERAEVVVVDGDLRIVPLDRDAYPPGFILRSAPRAPMWRGDLVPPVSGTTSGERRVAGLRTLVLGAIEPVQGRAGTWVLFGDGLVDSAFRPDDPSRFEAMLRSAGVPVRAAAEPMEPPEPTGGLLALGLVLQLLIVVSAVGLLVELTGRLAPAATVAVTLAVIGGSIAVVLAIRRWWFGSLMVRVSRRQRRRSAIDGRAQPQAPSVPGLGTLLVFVAVGSVAGLALLAAANERYRSLAFPVGGGITGLVLGSVWVVRCHLSSRNRGRGRNT